jgi:hypothetical protein
MRAAHSYTPWIGVRPQVSKCGCDQSFALVPPISVLKAFVYAASDFVGCRDIAAFRITFELPKNVLP